MANDRGTGHVSALVADQASEAAPDHASADAPTHTATASLIARARGEGPDAEQAFDALVSDEIPSLFRFIRARVDDDRNAEDLVQETLLAVWRQLGQFDGRSRFTTWMLAIARYRVIDWQRSQYPQRRRQAGSLDDQDFTPGQQLGSPDEGEAIALRATVARLLTSVSDEDRQLLQLVFGLGLNYEEAGRALGIPSGTVKSRMHRLRRQLHSRWEDKHDT